MNNEITIEDGIRIWIPKHLFNKKDREHIPGIRFHNTKECWLVYVSKDTITAVNKFFKINLPIPNYEAKCPQFRFKTEPFKYQLEALGVSHNRKSFALLMEQGTGKTKVIIDNAQILQKAKQLLNVVVICPKSVMGSWIRELHTHGYSKNWNINKWPNITLTSSCTLRWLIINIDAVNTDKGYRAVTEFLLQTTERSMLVVDESTTIKNHLAKRTKRVLNLSRFVKYRRIMTGTPIANNPLDLFTQFAFLDSNIFYSWTYWAFRAHFAIMGGWEDKQIMGFRNLNELAGIISPFSFRVTKDECLDLPDRIYQIREIELSQEAQKMYERVVNETIIALETLGKKITAHLAITKLAKLRQVTGGFVKTDDGTVVAVDHAKLDEVLAILNETSGKAIIWCEFTHEIKAIRGMLTEAGIFNTEISGDVSEAKRDENIVEFEVQKEPRVIVCQTDTGGLGLTLNAASVAIFFSNSVKYTSRIQAEARNHRAGQTKKVTYIDLVVPKSIDTTILKTLEKKHALATEVLNAIQARNLKQVLMGGVEDEEANQE